MQEPATWPPIQWNSCASGVGAPAAGMPHPRAAARHPRVASTVPQTRTISSGAMEVASAVPRTRPATTRRPIPTSATNRGPRSRPGERVLPDSLRHYNRRLSLRLGPPALSTPPESWAEVGLARRKVAEVFEVQHSSPGCVQRYLPSALQANFPGGSPTCPESPPPSNSPKLPPLPVASPPLPSALFPPVQHRRSRFCNIV